MSLLFKSQKNGLPDYVFDALCRYIDISPIIRARCIDDYLLAALKDAETGFSADGLETVIEYLDWSRQDDPLGHIIYGF